MCHNRITCRIKIYTRTKTKRKRDMDEKERFFQEFQLTQAEGARETENHH